MLNQSTQRNQFGYELVRSGTGGLHVRLATIMTPRGLRLHVAGASGYVDVADATGQPELASLGHVLAAGDSALDAVRRASERPGVGVAQADFGPAVPEP